MKAIILAGGFGTRLKHLTENMPKPLLPIKGKPIMEHAMDNFKRHGIKDILISVSYCADQIEDYFKDGGSRGVNIAYCFENEPLGTGGAIKSCTRGISETFIAINGDNLADFDWTAMLEQHKETGAKITMALYPVDDVTQYGIAKLDGQKIVKFIEKPSQEDAPSNLNNAGAYIIEPDALDILPDGKSSMEKDCFEKLAEQGVVYAFPHEGQWFPTDTIEKYGAADKGFKPHE